MILQETKKPQKLTERNDKLSKALKKNLQRRKIVSKPTKNVSSTQLEE